jgi:hypothetical protein
MSHSCGNGCYCKVALMNTLEDCILEVPLICIYQLAMLYTSNLFPYGWSKPVL